MSKPRSFLQQPKDYAYLQQLVDEYLLGDGFQTFYNRTRSLIDELVKTDPNALYTYEEYETALATLCELVELRGQAIDGQLDGTIPSTENEQKNSDTLIDASHIDLPVMGSMNIGGGRESFGNFENGGDRPDNMSNTSAEKETSSAIAGTDAATEQETDGTTTPHFNMGNIPGMSASGSSQLSTGTLLIDGGCFALLIAALVFVVLFKRKPRKR